MRRISAFVARAAALAWAGQGHLRHDHDDDHTGAVWRGRVPDLRRCLSGWRCMRGDPGPGSSQCPCFPPGGVCGDPPGGGVMCNPGTQDCGQLAAAYALTLAGPCPPGSICTTAIAHVFACGPPGDLCAIIEGRCVP